MISGANKGRLTCSDAAWNQVFQPAKKMFLEILFFCDAQSNQQGILPHSVSQQLDSTHLNNRVNQVINQLASTIFSVAVNK